MAVDGTFQEFFIVNGQANFKIRITLGLRNRRFSVSMQPDKELMLESVITRALQSQEVKWQQVTLSGQTRSETCDTNSIDRVFKGSNKGNSKKYASPL
ncbi:unnamed protein product [Boreogadus saida]